MRLPDFLVIGAMKAGTTSLCWDLEAHPSIFFPSVKEPHTLCLDEVLTEEGRKKYAALFDRASPEQICGEGSTGYTKQPLHTGVPERARQLLGADLKLIYIVREPVARTLSHHYHMYRAGDAPRDIGQALRQIPSLVNVSRYAMQLDPWIETFGLANLHVVRFEDFVQARTETVNELCTFLRVSPESGTVDTERVHNAGENQLLPPDLLRGIIRKITRSQWYKRNVHPHISQGVRDLLKHIVYEPAKDRPDPPSPEVIEYIIEHVQEDVDRLSQLLDRNDLKWDLEAVHRQYVTEERK